MITWLWLLLALAQAESPPEFHVVRRGETIERIAEQLGDQGLASALRVENQLAAGTQPRVGTLLKLPRGVASVECQPSFILRHEGAGQVTLPTGEVLALQDFLPLPVDAVVCTGDDAFASVRLSSRSDGRTYDDVTLLPNTCVQVRAVSSRPTGGSALVRLTEGSLSILGGAAGSQVVVETDAGLTVGDEGAFRVAVEDDTTRAESVSASVATVAQGKQVDLPAGYGNRTVAGQAPGGAVALLRPGTLITPPFGSTLLRHDFSWSPVPRAIAYAFEVSRDPAFQDMVFRSWVPPSPFLPPRIVVPGDVERVWWRVSGVDRNGYEGLPSQAFVLEVPQFGVAE